MPMFKQKFNYPRHNPPTPIGDVVEYEIDTADRGGAIESLRASVDKISTVLALIASHMSAEQQQELAEALGWELSE